MEGLQGPHVAHGGCRGRGESPLVQQETWLGTVAPSLSLTVASGRSPDHHGPIFSLAKWVLTVIGRNPDNACRDLAPSWGFQQVLHKGELSLSLLVKGRKDALSFLLGKGGEFPKEWVVES